MKSHRDLMSLVRGRRTAAQAVRPSPRRVVLTALALESRECPSSNLILNPSVETAAGNRPANWQTDSWGTNKATFSYLNGGLDGKRSLQLQVSGWKSGDAKWVFSDVKVTPGETYTFTNLYRSNVQSAATVRYTMANGSFLYVGDYRAPASNSTATFKFDFTAPAGAVSATVFHLLKTNGTLISDAYSLVSKAAPPPDTTAPTVSVSAPTGGATVSGTVTLRATANDNVGVAGVRFLVNGTQVGSEVTAAPYQVSLDTTKLANGSYAVTAVARDAAGNSTTSAAVNFTVSNSTTPPTPTPSNLIQNPSLETLDGSGNPVGWTPSSWGTNAPSFSLVAGTDGARAARVEIGSYSSGDAKWAFAGVPVSANTTYTFANAYRASIASKLVAEYTLTDGTKSYAYIAGLGATSNWTNTSYQVTTPANVAAMTVFHLIEGAGWLETDRYSLTAPGTGGGGGGGGGIPSGGMVSFTFDDGWLSQWQNAVPVLQQYDLPASFYIITRANQGGQAWEEVQNRSLETVGTNGSPVGWTTTRTGTNNAVFSLANTGSDGTRSARIDVSNLTSGNAAWAYQDVMVQPGTQYALAHDYNATVPTSVVIRFTLNNGSTVTVDGGTLGATGGQWQTYQRTVTAPAGADAMTVLHLIGQAGTLSTDNYSAKPVNPYSNPNYMTPSQVQSLYASGFEIGSHTMTHADLATLSAAGVRAEVSGSYYDLVTQMGITPTTFVYPYGSFNTGVSQVVASQGYAGARSTIDGYNTGGTNPYALLHQEVDIDTPLSDVQTWINTAAANGQWLILTFHEVSNTGGYYRTTPESFQQIAAMVAASSLTPVTVAGGLARL